VPASPPYLQLSGPTVDDDIRRLIRRYGAATVKEAVKRHTARRRGRRPIGIWLELSDVLREDAVFWLDGGDPLKTRSNHSIAKKFVAAVPDHQKPATRRRTMRKLSERRLYYTLVEAEHLSETQYPFEANLRAIRGLLEIGLYRDLWERKLRLAEAAIADYRCKFGDPPASMTMQELLAESAKPVIPTHNPGTNNVLQILLGTRSN
jgi:hypothetical protein